MNTYKKILTALLFITANISLAVADDVTIRNLLVEYEQRPMGIETLRPRFSWQMADKKHSKGQCQKAYRIVVEDEYGREYGTVVRLSRTSHLTSFLVVRNLLRPQVTLGPLRSGIIRTMCIRLHRHLKRD